ncbi:hypothetical protein BX616_008343, partial [Lobosporangium transversale]
MASLVNVFAWESFRKLLLVGYENLALPMSDNASIFLDLVVFHAASDPLIFAIRTSLVFSFFCWFMSMATGTHSWNLLLVAITVPVYTAWRASLVETTPLNWIDAVATLLFISGFTLETIADRQQWTFQEKKRKAIINKEALIGDYKRGFLTQGLFRYSRHPNFFGEMTIW